MSRSHTALPAAALGACLLLGACTWVEPDSRGREVRVAYDADLSACVKRGEVTVSVKHSIAGIERNSNKVRDELESYARNEAAALGANTVQALDEPDDGEQRYGAWICG
jgi:hypothetical protein